jgi:hypothetical protein
MTPKHLSRILAVGVILAAAGTAAAQPAPTNNPTAAANVRDSKEYSALLRSNPSFRKKRMAAECGPITDPQLHASCIASFNGSAPPQ